MTEAAFQDGESLLERLRVPSAPGGGETVIKAVVIDLFAEAAEAIEKAEALISPAKLQEAVASFIKGPGMDDVYDCLRVWEAWSVGTMKEDDFIQVKDDDERISDISAQTAKGLWDYTIANVIQRALEHPEDAKNGPNAALVVALEALLTGKHNLPIWQRQLASEASETLVAAERMRQIMMSEAALVAAEDAFFDEMGEAWLWDGMVCARDNYKRAPDYPDGIAEGLAKALQSHFDPVKIEVEVSPEPV